MSSISFLLYFYNSLGAVLVGFSEGLRVRVSASRKSRPKALETGHFETNLEIIEKIQNPQFD
jgi:hypothetical protein